MSSYEISTYEVTKVPVMVVPAQGNRKSAIISVPNYSGSFHTVYIAETQAKCTLQDGFQLTGQGTLTIEANQSPIWIRGLEGGEIVNIKREYTD